MHINTKVVFEWNPRSNEYVEVYSEGFEYEGDVAQCQYTMPGGDEWQQIQSALTQYGISPETYGLTQAQMQSLFSQTGGAGIADIFGVEDEGFLPFNVGQFQTALGGVGRQRTEDIQYGTENIRSRMFPGIKKAMGQTGGFAGGGGQQNFLTDILRGGRQQLGGMFTDVGREYQKGLGTAFGGLGTQLGSWYDLASMIQSADVDPRRDVDPPPGGPTDPAADEYTQWGGTAPPAGQTCEDLGLFECASGDCVTASYLCEG